MRVASFVLCALLCSSSSALAQEVVPAPTEGPDTSGTVDSVPELTLPAIPEGYVASVRGGSNVRFGPGPGERRALPDGEGEAPEPLPSSDPLERVLLEIAGAGAAIGLGWGLGYASGELENDDEVRVALTLVFSYLLLPTMTSLGGLIAGGRGNWGGAFLGETVGIGLGALCALWAIEERSEEGMWTALMLLPSVAAIVGLEIQHALRVDRAEQHARETANAGVTVSMSVVPTRGGGLLMVGGTF